MLEIRPVATNRFIELDFMKVVMVTAVIANHLVIEVIGKHSVSPVLLNIILSQFSRFGTHAYLFISGFLAFFSYQKLPYLKYMVKRSMNLLIPYLTWSILGLLIYPTVPELICSTNLGIKEPILQLMYFLMVLLTGNGPFYQLYFIPLLFQMYLLLPIIDLMCRKPRFLVILTITSILLLVAYELIYLQGIISFEKLQIMHLVVKTTFPLRLLYFVSGYLIALNYDKFKECLRSTPLIYLIILLFLSSAILIVDISVLLNKYPLISPALDSFRLAVLLYSFACILVFIRIGTKFNYPWVQWVSQYTFGIYLCHIFVLKELSRHLNSNQYSGLDVLLLILTTLILSFLITVVMKKSPFNKLLLGIK